MGEMGMSLKRLILLCRTESNKMIAAILFAMTSFTISVVPYYMVYRVVTESTSANPRMGQIINYAGIALVAIVIRVAFFVIATGISHRAAFMILYKLRVQIAKTLLTLPLGYFANKDLGAMKMTINEDVEKLELFIAHNVSEIIGAVTLPVVTAVFLFFMD